MKKRKLKSIRKWSLVAVDNSTHKKLHISARKLGISAKKLAEEILEKNLDELKFNL